MDPCDGCSQPLDSWVCKSCFFYLGSGLVLPDETENHPELFLSDEAYDFGEECQLHHALDQAGH